MHGFRERGGFGCRDAAVSRRRVSGTLRVGAGAIADEPRGERVHQRGLDLHAQGDLLSRRAPHAAARRGPGGRHPSSSRARRHRACARDRDVQRRRRHGSRDGAMPPNRTRGSFARRSVVSATAGVRDSHRASASREEKRNESFVRKKAERMISQGNFGRDARERRVNPKAQQIFRYFARFGRSSARSTESVSASL